MKKFVYKLILIILVLCSHTFAMQIFIREYYYALLTGRTVLLDVEPTDTIDQIKAKIQDKWGYLPENLTLYFNSTLLEDGRTLADYSIPKEQTIDAFVYSTQRPQMHLCADNGVQLSGSAVTGWNDISGNSNNALQESAINQPSVVYSALNGYPVINFNGTSSKMTLPSAAALGIQNHDYEMFFVARTSSAATQFLISGALEQYEYHLNLHAGARFIPITGVYLDHSLHAAFADGNAHIFSARASLTGGAVRVDGIDGGTSTADLTSSDPGSLTLGYRNDGCCYFNGDIAEVIMYNRVLTPTERTNIELYLANRYNITSGALPVQLISFTAQAQNDKVVLNWQTATEVNNYGFEVERSLVTGHQLLEKWEKVGFVPGNGNSNSPKMYSFVDFYPPTGNIQYRLKQIDTDGKYEYYPTIAELSYSITGIKNKQMPSDFCLQQNYPNPFNPVTVIGYQLPSVCRVELKVYDILGNVVSTLVNEQKQPGYYSIEFNAGSLPSGIYLFKMTADKFISVKKLAVIK
jgi:hypothetical protein